VTVALLIIAAVVVWLASLYLAPFGPCPRCHGRGRIMRGTKKRPRPVQCPRCKGAKRRQRPGSRIVHQLARRVRREINRNRQQHAAASTTPKE
jgi:hypothetical protein